MQKNLKHYNGVENRFMQICSSTAVKSTFTLSLSTNKSDKRTVVFWSSEAFILGNRSLATTNLIAIPNHIFKTGNQNWAVIFFFFKQRFMTLFEFWSYAF